MQNIYLTTSNGCHGSIVNINDWGVERRINAKQDTNVTVENWNKRISAVSMYEKKISRKT